jgi:hypothetical protein
MISRMLWLQFMVVQITRVILAVLPPRRQGEPLANELF